MSHSFTPTKCIAGMLLLSAIYKLRGEGEQHQSRKYFLRRSIGVLSFPTDVCDHHKEQSPKLPSPPPLHQWEIPSWALCGWLLFVVAAPCSTFRELGFLCAVWKSRVSNDCCRVGTTMWYVSADQQKNAWCNAAIRVQNPCKHLWQRRWVTLGSCWLGNALSAPQHPRRWGFLTEAWICFFLNTLP